MHTLLLSGVVSVWIFTGTFVDGALTISYTGSNKVDSTSYSLKCDIQGFSALASLSRNGILIAQCLPSMCTTTPVSPYSNRQDATAIYVDFSTLAASEDGIQWTCAHAGDTSVTFKVLIDFGPTSEMSTLMDTERMTSINSISEFGNTSLPTISEITTTSIGTSNFVANTQSNEIQTNTLRIISNSVSTYQSMFVTATATDISGSFEIPMQTMTGAFTMTVYTISSYIEIISPSTFETSLFFSQAVSETSISMSVNTISDSLIHTLLVSSGFLIATDSSEFSILSMTISPSDVGNSNIPSLGTSFSVPSITSDTIDSAFEITNVSLFSNFSLTTETVITPILTATIDSSAVNTVLNSTKSESLLLSISENNNRTQQIETNTEYSLITATFSDQISYSSKIEEPFFSSYQDLSETSVTLSEIRLSSQLSSSIIDTMDHFIYTTNTLMTSHLDDTRHSFVNFTSFFQPLSLDYAASASTSLPYFIKSTYHHSTLQTTEYYTTIQTEFISDVTTSFYETNTDNVATGIYSQEIVTSGKSYMHTSVMPSIAQFSSMNNIQDSTIDLQSTFFNSYSQSNDEGFSSSISKYFLSTLQSTSVSLPFNTKANVSGVESYMETTNMMTFESQSGIQTKNLTLLTNPSSIQIPAVSFDFKPTLLTTAININSKTMPSMINPSSQRTNKDNSYNEIDTSSKDLSSFINSKSESVTFRELLMTTLSSKVIESESTMSTSTVQSGLSEKNKNIIVIGTTSALVTIIVVIVFIFFGKLYVSEYKLKPRKKDDNISWCDNSCSTMTAFPDYSFTGKSIYPMLDTSSNSFKINSYKQNWNDIV